MKALLEAGVEIDNVLEVDFTPLYVAAERVNTAMVKVLIDAGAKVNRTVLYPGGGS